MRRRTRVVVFCDLDSLLVPPELTVPGPRAGTLEHLDEAGVAVVLSSSRTRAEIDWFAQQLRIRSPFIAEHGGGVFVPAGYFDDVPGSRPIAGYDAVEFGRSYASVVDQLRRTAARLDVAVRAMADMSIEDVSRTLGTPLPLARLTKLRGYTELFQVDDDTERPRLFRALRAAHLHCVEGDHLHQVGATVDASLGVALLRSLYRRSVGSVVTIGIGDLSTEPDLLRLVDFRVRLSPRGLMFPPTLLDVEPPCGVTPDGSDVAALVEPVNDVVAAVRRAGVDTSGVVNQRFT